MGHALIKPTKTETRGRMPALPDMPGRLDILIVDDNTFDRRRIARCCVKSGLNMEVAEAATLAEMQSVLDRHRFDLVVVDYLLPDGDGIEALARIRSHARQRGAATLMITGQPDSSVASAAQRAGCGGYFQKTDINVDVLRGAVLNAVRRKTPDTTNIGAGVGQGDTAAGPGANHARTMRTLLARMLRQIRAVTKNDPGMALGLVDLDTSCQTLFTLLEKWETGTPDNRA